MTRLRLVLAIALGVLTTACVILFLGMVTAVRADPPQSWYVAPDGSDVSNCGKEISPCLTIAYAISEASASVGATIIITPGIFTESVTLNRAITLTGAGMGQTIIRTGAPGITVTASQVIISGTTLIGQGSGEGITITAGITDVSIWNVQVYSYSTGIQVNGGSGHLLQGNVITGNSIGIVAAGDLSFVAHSNTISGSLTAGILFTGTGPLTATLSGETGYTNTFRNNRNVNITLTLPSTNTPVIAYWNDWGTNTIAGIEGTIFHQPDNTALAKVDFYTLTIAATPLTRTADGTSPINITSTVSGFDTPGAGDVISFTTSRGILSAFTATTDANGQASVWLTSTVAGTAVVTATSGITINNVQTVTTTVDFTPGALTTITVSPNPVTITAGMTQTFTATGYDSYSNTVTVTPTWNTNGGNVYPGPNATTVYTAQTTVASGRLVTATHGGVSGTAVVNIVAGALTTITVSPNPATVTAGMTQTFTATGYDSYSNTVTVTPTWNTNGGNVYPGPNATTVYTAQPTVASGRLVTATHGGISGTAVVNIVPGALTTITVSPDPITVTAGMTRTFTANGYDVYSNALPITPTWTSNVSSAPPVNVGNGLTATAVFTAQTHPAPVTGIITAAYSGVTGTAVVNIVAGALTTITVSPNPVTVTAGTTQTFTANGYDVYSNALPITPTWASDVGSTPVSVNNGLTATAVFTSQTHPAPVTGVITAAYSGVTGTAVVNVAPGAVTTITVQVSSSTLIAKSNATSIITATASDLYDNRVAGAPLSGSTLPSWLGTVSPLGTTNVSGQVTGTWTAGPIIDSGTLSVTNGSISGTAAITLTAGPPYSVTLQPAIASTVVTNTYIRLTAKVKDQFTNWVTDGTTVTFATTLGYLLSDQEPTAGGTATSWIRSTQAGIATITATCGSAQPATATVTFTPDVPYSITLQANPISLTVGTNSVLTATVFDQYHNVVSDVVTVTFNSSSGSSNVVPSVVTTTNGIATSRMTDTLAGPKFITATSQPPAQVPGTTTVTFTPDMPYTVTVVATPTTQIVGNNSMLVVTITDRYSNTVANGTPVTLTVSRGNIVSPVTTTNGIATSWISDTLVGTRTITATSGVTRTGTTTVTFAPGAPYTVTLVAQPVSQTVGLNSTLRMTVTDRYRNTVANGTSVTLTVSRGSVVSPVTTTNGIATSWISDTLVGPRLITATSGLAPVRGTATVTFTPGLPYTVTLVASPTVQVVGNNSVLTATVVDRFGNWVVNGTSVNFTTDLGYVLSPRLTANGIATSLISATLPFPAHIVASSMSAPVQGTATVTFIPGAPYTITLWAEPPSLYVGNLSQLRADVRDQYSNTVANGTYVTFTADLASVVESQPRTTYSGLADSHLYSEKAGTAHITATSGSVQVTTTVYFTPGVPSTITVQVYPDYLVAQSGATATITATITDLYGNPLAGQTLTGTFPITTMGIISGPGTTNAAGQARGMWTAGTIIGSAQLSVTNGIITGSTAVSLISGTPTTITVQVSPFELVANSGMTGTITATVVDVHNNVVSNVSLSGETLPSTLGGVGVFERTNENGQAFGTWTAGDVVGSGRLRVSTDTGTSIVSGTAAITLTSGPPYTVTLVATPTLQIVGNISLLTVTVTDRYSNTVANGTLVTFTRDLGGVVSPVTTTNGVATSHISSTVAGTAHITATSESAQPGTATVTFAPGAPYTGTLVATPPTQVVGNDSVLTLVATDQYDNWVANGTAVTFTTDAGNLVSSGATMDGVATAWISTTLASTAHITATIESVSVTTTVVFAPDAPYSMTLIAIPAWQVVGNSSALTATVADRFNNRVANGTPITLVGDLGSITSPVMTTNGVATSQISSTVSGAAHITATSGSAQDTSSVVFAPDWAFATALEADPARQTVGENSVLTATVTDRFGNRVADGVSVTLMSTLGTLLTPTTTINGIATSLISSTQVGTAHITATSGSAQPGTATGGLAQPGTATVVFVPGPPDTTDVQVEPSTLLVNSGATAAITATVWDGYSNLVPGVTLTVEISPTTLGRVDWQHPTNENGQAFGTWTVGSVPGSGVLQVGNTFITLTVAPRTVYLPLMMRNYPGQVTINNGAQYTYRTQVTLALTATAESMRISNDEIVWSDWAPFNTTADWTLDSGNGLKTVYVQLRGGGGGVATVSDDILLFNNGDFSAGLAAWTQSGNLGAAAVSSSGDPVDLPYPVARLGNPSYPCDGVPKDYAGLSQSFTVPNVPGKQLVLKFSYRIYTDDRNLHLTRDGDRFEVLFNEREALKDMNQDKPFGCGKHYDLGLNNASIPVTDSPGTLITVTFRAANRFDSQYNTYVYLDNVRLEFGP